MACTIARALFPFLLGASILTNASEPVGRMPGNLTVTPSGQASYEIPIQLPAGAAGMTPSLSLRYSSTEAMGLAGVGWGLSGLSAITRCSHNKILDGAYNVDVTLTETDKLCLDGQRLLSGGVAKNQTAAGWLGTATTYTTQLQNFEKITATIDEANKQPQQLTVVTKDGRTLTYGGSADSRIIASPRYDNATMTLVPSSQVITWLLTRIQDKNGNAIKFTYAAGLNGSAAVISNISYTENTATSPEMAAVHDISFDYEAHHVLPYTYIAGSKLRSDKILKAIRINSVDPSGQNLVEIRRYTLDYRATSSELTKRPLLASVQLCEARNGMQQCLKPTVFEWMDGIPEFGREILGPAWANSGTPTKWNCGGVSGTDYCEGAIQVDGTTNSWSGDPSYFSTIRYGDIDGDGKADICGRNSAGMQCHLSTGNGFSSSAISAPAWSNANGWDQESKYTTIQFADINGDGRADLCGRNNSGLECHVSLGVSGFDATPVTMTNFGGSGAGTWGDTTKKYYYTIRFFDLNQDGVSDVCGVGPAGLSCYYIRTSGVGAPVFEAATVYNQIANNPPTGLLAWSTNNLDFHRMIPVLMPMNLNRSRDLALCARGMPTSGSTTSDGYLMCIVPLSGGTASATMFNLNLGASSTGSEWRSVRFVDINGDGWTDVCSESVLSALCVKNGGQGGSESINSFVNVLNGFQAEFLSSGTPSESYWDPMTAYIWLNVFGKENFAEPPGNTQEWIYYKVAAANKGVPHYATLRYVDVNGDGLADVCERAPDGFHCRVQRRLSSNWVCHKALPVANSIITIIDGNEPIDPSSCDGEFMGQIANPWLNTTDGYIDTFAYRIDLPVAWSDWTSPSQPTNWDLPQHFQTIEMVDVTGDGRLDVCGRDSEGIKCYTSENPSRDLITSIIDGYGEQARLTYQPLTDNAVFTRGTGAIYPDMDLQPGMLVVSAVEMGDGIGGTRRISYRYAGLKANVDYGSQGFAQTQVRDETSGRVTVTHFQQSFPYTGMPNQVDEYQCPTELTPTADCFLLQQKTVGNWGQKDVLPAPFTAILPYATATTERRWDLPSGAAIGAGGAVAAASQIALSVSTDPVAMGATVELTAQVSNGLASPPTGSVTFLSDIDGIIGTSPLNDGAASMSASFAAAGPRNLRAVYSGDGSSGGSTSAVTSLVVTPVVTGVVLAVSPMPQAARGQPVTLTATVTGSAPTGTVEFSDGATSLGEANLDSGGNATLSVSWEVDGVHNLKASYHGNQNNAAAESGTTTVSVGAIAPTVDLVVTMSPETFGSATTLQATVNGYNPTGTVTFLNGTTELGATNLDAQGKATLSTSSAPLPVGVASLSAVYSGDNRHVPANSSIQNLTVAKRLPTLVFSADPTYIAADFPVDLIVTMGSIVNGTPPTGTVVFKNNGNVMGTGTLTNGVASITKTFGSSGPKDLSFEYSGDSNYSAATLAKTFKIRSDVPKISLSTDPSSGLLASTKMSLTATVTNGNSPGGTVTFKNGDAVLGTATLSQGEATLSKTKYDVDSYVITATYNGDVHNGARTSSARNRTVAKANPTLTLSALPSQPKLDQSVELTATLTLASKNPGGSIVFKDGETTIGIQEISGTTAVLEGVFSTLGSHNLTASFSEDANNLAAISPALVLNVGKRAATISLATSASEALVDGNVTLSAAVEGHNPTGTITFKSGTTTIGASSIDASGMATLTTSFASAGTKSITAVYEGDENNVAITSAATSIAIKSTLPTVTLTLGGATVGSSSSATVTVSGSSPTGAVIIKEGASTRGTATLNNGVATVTVGAISTAGPHALTAHYVGDVNNMSAASVPVSLDVGKRTSASTLSMSKNPSNKWEKVTATVTVDGYQPTGTVRLVNASSETMGQAEIDTATSPRTATITYTFYAAGEYPLAAVYDGDANNNPSESTSISQIVNSVISGINLAVSPGTAAIGQRVLLTASVYLGGVPVSGTVTFMNGTSTLGSAPVQDYGGSYYAQLPYTFAEAGSYSLTATHTPAGGSLMTSAPNGLVVTKVQPSIELAADTASTQVGGSVTLSATIAEGMSPTGTVTFKEGSTVLGTGAVTAGIATLTTSFASVGDKLLTAEYSGDVKHMSADDDFVLAVGKATPTILLSASPSPASEGQPVTLTATLSGGYGGPSGTVTFMRNTVTLGTATITNGIATLTTVFESAGAESLTAVYGGDTNNNSAISAAVPLTITAAFQAIQDWLFALFDFEEPPANDVTAHDVREAA